MRHLVEKVITDTLLSLKGQGTLRVETVPAFGVDPPKSASHGDYATNVAMMLQKAEGKPPRQIAEAIVKGLVDTDRVVAKIDIAGPGFLNLTLNDAVIQRVARDVLVAGAQWGRRARGPHSKKVMVEFVSANPTGPVHIGHARGAFMGDALARLLDAAGHDVTREFYINDFGKQVDTLGRTVWKRYQQRFGRPAELAEGEYPADYVKEIAEALQQADGERWLNASVDEALPRCRQIAIDHNLNTIKATLLKAGIKHDVFTSEAALHAAGRVTGVVDHYRARGVTYDADRAKETDDKVRRDDSKAAHYAEQQLGGTFLTTSAHGDDEDRIVLRKDGTPVYLTADLAYHKDKFDRGFDRMVDVFGADHSGHVPRIKAGVHLLGVDEKRLDFVLVQIVRITRDGQEVKVSKRKGTVFELDDLIDEAGADPCRFLFLMKTANAQVEFDLALVQKASRENPVFGFQYGHARCAAILRKAIEEGTPFAGERALTDAALAKLVLPEERDLLKKMSHMPDVVLSAAEALEPHRVLYFCSELIADFHSYYTKYKKTERVISDDVDKTQARLALVAGVKHTLKSVFDILGVDAPERMSAPKDEPNELGEDDPATA
jgi:arginyl-tRNA synthetase